MNDKPLYQSHEADKWFEKFVGLAKRIDKLEVELAAARAVVEAARAFKIHGVAKDGAHAMFLFKALLSYDKVRGKGEGT